MNVAKAGPHFHATGGAALNTDDFFLAREIKVRLAAVDTLVAKKEAWDMGGGGCETEGSACIYCST
jgi:hypothetical protein